MAASIAPALAKVRKVLPNLAGDTDVEVRRKDGVIHRGKYCDLCSMQSEPIITVSLSELKASNTCERCLRAYTFTSFHQLGPVFNAVHELIVDVRRSSAFTSDKSTLLLRQIKRLNDSRERVTKLWEEFTKYSVHGRYQASQADEEGIETLLSEAALAHSRLRRQLRSEDEREKALNLVKAALLPVGSEEFFFDETPTLLALHPFRASEWPKIVGVLKEQFAVRDEPLVLALPHYAVEYLALAFGGARANYCLSASALGLSEDQLDTAARLWEPFGTGPYSSLAATVAAARAL